MHWRIYTITVLHSVEITAKFYSIYARFDNEYNRDTLLSNIYTKRKIVHGYP